MYLLNNNDVKEIEETTFASIELVEEIFQPYVENHLDEFSSDPYESLNSYKIALRAVREFMESNEIDPENFNRKQRIILIASEFDDQTLSAAAWLNSNKINISCYEIKTIPYHVRKYNC